MTPGKNGARGKAVWDAVTGRYEIVDLQVLAKIVKGDIFTGFNTAAFPTLSTCSPMDGGQSPGDVNRDGSILVVPNPTYQSPTDTAEGVYCIWNGGLGGPPNPGAGFCGYEVMFWPGWLNHFKTIDDD